VIAPTTPLVSQGAPWRLAFVLIPRFSLITLGCATEAFRLANERHDKPPFLCRMIGVQPGDVCANDGLRIATDGTIGATDRDWDMIFLISSLSAVDFDSPALAAWLRRAARAGIGIAPLGAATVLAARLGLLDGYRCVTHFRLYARFLERFPRVRLERGLYCIDRRRITCAGGLAALDLGLRLISDVVAPKVAHEVAEIAMTSRIRDGAESQRMSVRWRYGVSDHRVEAALELMERNLEHPLALSVLARAVRLSVRQLERLFLAELGRLPHRQYLDIRLRRSHDLLVDTDEPVLAVALKCGFGDATRFARLYRDLLGEPPSATRHAARRVEPAAR
jgi:AraC family carnitine catabolism transcriptional activator